MPLRALYQLRENIANLLRVRHEDQKALALYLHKHPTTINKFLKGTREMQLADLDGMADFFGIATYQLFQPGISPLTERRRLPDRRSGVERRIGHTQRQILGLAGQVDQFRPKRRSPSLRSSDQSLIDPSQTARRRDASPSVPTSQAQAQITQALAPFTRPVPGTAEPVATDHRPNTAARPRPSRKRRLPAGRPGKPA